jgi:hypothetical protein
MLLASVGSELLSRAGLLVNTSLAVGALAICKRLFKAALEMIPLLVKSLPSVFSNLPPNLVPDIACMLEVDAAENPTISVVPYSLLDAGDSKFRQSLVLHIREHLQTAIVPCMYQVVAGPQVLTPAPLLADRPLVCHDIVSRILPSLLLQPTFEWSSA